MVFTDPATPLVATLRDTHSTSVTAQCMQVVEGDDYPHDSRPPSGRGGLVWGSSAETNGTSFRNTSGKTPGPSAGSSPQARSLALASGSAATRSTPTVGQGPMSGANYCSEHAALLFYVKSGIQSLQMLNRLS